MMESGFRTDTMPSSSPGRAAFSQYVYPLAIRPFLSVALSQRNLIYHVKESYEASVMWCQHLRT